MYETIVVMIFVASFFVFSSLLFTAGREDLLCTFLAPAFPARNVMDVCMVRRLMRTVVCRCSVGLRLRALVSERSAKRSSCCDGTCLWLN
ncbi:hypothetical protein F4803DRAFT_481266 [Xylaria telfairii]|nr:hypothetical protein F4803DRAFT_481266 [Xylaria telfairii]